MARKKSREEWKIYGNVFDEFTNRHLFRLASQGYFEELTSALALGKEANIFLANTKDGGQVVVKIYRLENCNFNKMYEYLLQDERFQDLKGQRRKIIFSWVQREYRNLLKARESIRVPRPLMVKDNIIIMELMGEMNEAAPQLKNQVPKDIEKFFEETIECMGNLLVGGLVHGDLSAFNILNDDEKPIFIDFSQATTTKSHGWEDLLKRDVGNVVKFFSKHGVEASIDDVYDDLITLLDEEDEENNK
jgi:RIO kinase 1